jgi:uncharacterized repeat protein (TIGR03847 family)
MSEPSESFEFRAPDLFTAGAVGPPGQRVFYLQAREDGVLATLKVEKEQVNALAEYLAGLLERVSRPAAAVAGDLSLVEPLVPAWAVRSLGVGYDRENDRVVVVAQERAEEEEEDDDEDQESAPGATDIAAEPDEVEQESDPEGEGASARFHLSPAQAAAFVERARALVRAGRPPCGICGRPINPGGHICPRSNGHGRD